MSAEALLARYRTAVDARLDQLLPNSASSPAPLHSAMRYSCLAPGKRLRPALLLACFEHVQGEITETALDGACAVEMVHAFSLIHDDLPAIDNDQLRRGRATCHVKFGEGIALLAGDALFALAFETLLHSSPLNPHPSTLIPSSAHAALSLARASGSGGLVGGEVRDVLAEGLPFSIETVTEIHNLKTGALIAASCEIGAILGLADTETRACLRSFGENVGLAFQIADDVLNETSTQEQLGKSAGSDKARSKATFPALMGARESSRVAIEAVDRALSFLEGMEAENLRLLARYSVERLH